MERNISTTPRDRRIALLVPAGGWATDDFERYWTREHGPLVASTPDYALYREAYVQDHILGAGPVGAAFPFAGIASVRMPLEPLDFASTPMFRERILPDEQKFLDRRASVAFRTAEYRVGGRRDAVKVIVLSQRGAGQTPETFREGVLTRYVDAVLAVPAVSGTLAGWTINLVAAPPTDFEGNLDVDAAPVDVIEEYWFGSMEAMAASFTARNTAEIAVVEEELFSPARSSFRSRELVYFEDGRPLPTPF